MIIKKYYILLIVFLLGIVFSTIKAEDAPNKETTTQETGAKSHATKKAKSESYLEKIQRRYISRLPYLMIPLMVVPIIKKGDVIGYLTIMVELKGKSVDSYRQLLMGSIMIRDEIFSDLYLAMSRLWLGPEQPSAAILENRIKKRINEYYKNDFVENAQLHVMQLTLMHNL